MWDAACLLLEMAVELFFFPFLFPVYFCSVDACVVSIVSGNCNQSSSLLFYIVFLAVESTISWMLASPRLPSLLDTYNMYTSYLGCIVMSFLVLWFICLNSSLVHFKNGPKYLMWRTASVFILLMRFLLCSLVSSGFLVLLRVFFLGFFFFIFLSSPHV